VFVLIDESLPGQLRNALPSHDARTVVQMGWRGTKNGELLRRAEAVGFNVLITADRNLEYQQNIARLGLGVVVLMVPKTDREEVLLLAPEILQALDRIKPGRVLHVGIDPRASRSRRV
jgi:hypothetical protein